MKSPGSLPNCIPSRQLNNRAVIVTGELSGEIHASHLIGEINKSSDIRWSGFGSSRLAQCGVEIIYDYRAISVTGLSEVLFKLKEISRAFRLLKQHINDVRPDFIILVDFPGFNLRIAQYAKKRNIPVIYFIPPQVWAWRSRRINIIKQSVDKVLSILPFEKELYDSQGIDTAYVGHPFVRSVFPSSKRDEFLERFGISNKRPIITIMPGSRENEIKRHMPLIMKTIHEIDKKIGRISVILPVAENVKRTFIEELAGDYPIHYLERLSHDALAHCDVSIVTSGSATLEAAILGTPSVVIYKISSFSYAVAKIVVHVEHISLPNIIVGKGIYPEFVQHIEPEDVAKSVIDMLKIGRKGIEPSLEEVRQKLGNYHSYQSASSEIINFIKDRCGPVFTTH